jgi:hypothetical protein
LPSEPSVSESDGWGVDELEEAMELLLEFELDDE